MRKSRKELQKTYRDRLRGKLPRPYRTKITVESVPVVLSVQELVNYGWHHHTTTWTQTISLGPVHFQLSHPENPHWLSVNGIRFQLSRWEALGGAMDRWAVDVDGRRYCKVYVLGDGRVGCRKGLKLIFRTSQQTRKNRFIKQRQKILKRLGENRDLEFIAQNPRHIPTRPIHRYDKTKSMRKRTYRRLIQKLAYYATTREDELDQGIVRSRK
jgi:hypothetical protein